MEILIRFLLGGAIVSAFAATGEMFKPKSFSGLFGAAPSVAIASLALAFRQHDAAYVATEARSMIIGSIAMLIYSAACVIATRRRNVPVWLAAGLSWVAWCAAAFGLFVLVQREGLA